MKIISNKRWEEMNQDVVELQLELAEARRDNDVYQEQVRYLQTQLKMLRLQDMARKVAKVGRPKKNKEEINEQPKKRGRKPNATKREN